MTKPMTLTEIRTIKALRSAGKTFNEIAKMIGRPRQTVCLYGSPGQLEKRQSFEQARYQRMKADVALMEKRRQRDRRRRTNNERVNGAINL